MPGQAKDVVVQVVSELEDCPLFNAGKGSALTADGVHEVRDVKSAFTATADNLFSIA